MKLADVLDQGGIDGLMRGIVRGRYHVLLGAGASAGGTSQDGRGLPIGKDLSAELAEEFGLPEGAADRHPLTRIYAAAARNSNGRNESVQQYVARRFSHTTPPAWMGKFAAFPWAQIWTLNVDDSVERAYAELGTSARQTPLSISWTEPHRLPRDSQSEVLLIHLHGKASKAAADDLIFDISGYINALQSQHRWHRIFGDTYPAHPFLVVGASLDQELDLEQVLQQGRSRNSEHPSLIVVKDCDDLQADSLREYGLVVVRSPVADVFDEITQMAPKYLLELTQEEASDMASLANEAQTFLHEWHELDGSPWPRRIDKGHNYYAGHEPTWRDTLNGLPFKRSLERTVVGAASQALDPGRSVIALIEGEAFSGKSSALLSAANSLREAGWRVFYFDSDRSPDPEAVVWWTARHPKSVLVVDDATDFAMDIQGMIRAASRGPIGLRFVIADRSSQAMRLAKVFYGLNVVTCELDSRLRDVEVDAMLSKLDSGRRLGVLQNKTARQRLDYVKSTCSRSVFEVMSSLEDGRGFRERIEDEWLRLTEEGDRALAGVCAVAASVGYAVPVELLRAAVGLDARVAEVRVKETRLHDVMVIREGFLRLRHRGFGEVLNRDFMPVQERLKRAKDLVLALAPHVSPAAIGANSLAYRMARSIMARRYVLNLANGSIELALKWFEDIHPFYDWNARFWEQRALLAADAGLFEEAFSWAQVGVSRRRDSYSLNTVGTVLMRRAVWEAAPDHWPWTSYERAVEALREARDLEGQDSEYPYETFFSYTARLVQKVAVADGSLKSQLSTMWVEWQVSSLGLAAAARASLAATMERAQAVWNEVVGE